ncbi:hypothetical protein BDR03DRAFT_964336 [Suillus americanus]|nr:hypothetical protein BDR03DRAFT_964336 [Suillus americanus]
MSSTPYPDLWLEQSHLNEIMLGAVSYGVFTCCGFEIDLCTSKGGSMYDIVVLVAIESAVLHSVFAIMFIVLFAVHSDVSNLCFLPISQWSCPGKQTETRTICVSDASFVFILFPNQGTAELLIIIRVARGRTITQEWSTCDAAAPVSIAFSETVGHNQHYVDSYARPGTVLSCILHR